MKRLNVWMKGICLLLLAGTSYVGYAYGSADTTVIDGYTAATPRKETKKCDKCKDVKADYNIPAQRFDETAQALAHATGCSIRTDLSKTGAIKVNAVKGKMSIRDAIKMAIKGTDLKVTQSKPGELTVELVK